MNKNNIPVLRQIQNLEDILDFEGACEYLDISPSSLYKKTHQRRIAYFKPDKRIYFLKSDLRNYLLQNRFEVV